MLPAARARRKNPCRPIGGVRNPAVSGVFIPCGGMSECEAAWRTKRVAHVLPVGDQDNFRNELEQIVRVVESGEPVALYAGLREGQRCRVTSGSLVGLEGVVLRQRTSVRMYIAATVLGQSAVVEIDCAQLEPLD